MACSAENQSRVEFIDLFRAFGIILMIMGHIKFGGCFDKWIHGFHMPMFFFISGWFFKTQKNIGEKIAKKARTLLVPYVCFELLQWMVLMLFIPEYRGPQTLLYVFTENTHKIMIENGTFGISPIPGAMWFLTAAFFAEKIYILIERILGCDWILHVAVVILVVVGMLVPTMLPFRLPLALDASFVGIGFLHIARMIKSSKVERCLNLKLWQVLVIGTVFTVSIMISPKINMRTGNYGWYLPFWINALGVIIAGWNLSRYVEEYLTHSGMTLMVSRWLKGIGRNSIIYLCFNQTVILVVTKAAYIIGFKGLIAKIPILFISMTILLCLEKLIIGTKFKVLVGK